MLFGQAEEAIAGRHAKCQFYDPEIQEGIAAFHRMGHGHAVPLGAEQIIGQEQPHFDVLRTGTGPAIA